jgi:hypothetical protein
VDGLSANLTLGLLPTCSSLTKWVMRFRDRLQQADSYLAVKIKA